jgi:hypothetical protein
VRLEPLAPAHEEDLWLASRDPATWRWLSIIRPTTRSLWSEYMGQALAATTAGMEIVLVTVCYEEVVGSTRFLALRPEHRSVEIARMNNSYVVPLRSSRAAASAMPAAFATGTDGPFDRGREEAGLEVCYGRSIANTSFAASPNPSK